MRWLKEYSSEITSATAICGVIVGVIGFSFTILQLIRTENTLRASNTYEVQRDARDLIEKISADARFSEFLLGRGDESYAAEFDKKLWQMLNFYLSVYRQYKAGGITPEFSNSFKSDFCRFLTIQKVSDRWTNMNELGKISASHTDMRSKWCDEK